VSDERVRYLSIMSERRMPVLDGERRLANLVGALTEDGEARAAHAYPETARVTPLSFDAPAQPTRETVSGIRYDQLDTGTYQLFSRSRYATSWHSTESMEVMVRFHRGARA
jgi:hypothetical protein